MPLEIWIPETARTPPQKKYRCLVCSRVFPETQKQQWARHVKACDKKNPEFVEGALAANEANPFKTVQDKEKFNWLRERAFEKGQIER